MKNHLFATLKIVLVLIFAIAMAEGASASSDLSGQSATEKQSHPSATHDAPDPSPSPIAKTGVRCMLDWFPNPNHAPLYVALDQGYFEGENLSVEFMVPSDPNDPLKLVAAGQIEFAVSYQPSVILARSQGLNVVSIAALVQHPLSTILYLKDSGISSLKDLKGRTIGYSVGPLYKVLFEAAAENAGLTVSDYELFRVGFNLLPPLLTGKADAVVGAFINFEAIQIELEGKEVVTAPFEKHGVPDFYELVLIAGDNFLKKSPEAARGFVKALTKGIEKTLEKPDQAMDIFFRLHPDLRDELHRKSFTTTLPYFKGSPGQSTERWRNLHDFMLERKLIEKPVQVGEMFENLADE